ncbi:MAG: hypothetical protein F4017_11915 [Acidimicrobiaceae bacterium]|nr:hypothetical protein [Acidimicrobiaceae bacterium]MYK75271.1 hypothetical protein [Acidimicrobiaceae bacterium]
MHNNHSHACPLMPPHPHERPHQHRHDVVLGLDAGTTSAKAVVVDRVGGILATGGSDPIATRTTRDGGSEQDPEEIWRALTAAARLAIGSVGPDASVATLAVAAQSGSVIPVLAGARAERAITWMDTRSESLVENWNKKIAETIRTVSGWAPTSGVGLSTIAWLRASGWDRQMGEDSPRSSRWCSVDDYLVFRLTGQWVTNPSNAAGMQLMDVTTRTWSEELCRVAGINADRLSPILESGTVAGGLTAEAASALGLEAGTPVVVGGHDQACAALGLGTVEPGAAFLSAGTAWVLTAVSHQADVGVLPPAWSLSPHVVPGLWTASVNLGGLGVLIAESPPDSTRAAFEACAHRVQAALEGAAETVAGGSELVMVGGGTRFYELVDVLADVIDRPVVTRPEAAWPAVGAARLAAAALGWTPHEGAP